MEPYIIINQINKKFKNDLVIQNLSLQIDRGKIYGFVGKNGSGKTVLFKLISGLLHVDSGEIIVNHQKLGKDIDFPPSMGILIETPGFLNQYNAFDNLWYLANIRNQITKTDVQNAISAVGLNPYDRKKVGKYSLGMKQRLGIAQALMENPELLILDEPMNSLDQEGTSIIRELIRESKRNGKTILLSSHYKEDIDYLCDIVYEMNKGKVSAINNNQQDIIDSAIQISESV